MSLATQPNPVENHMLIGSAYGIDQGFVPGMLRPILETDRYSLGQQRSEWKGYRFHHHRTAGITNCLAGKGSF